MHAGAQIKTRELNPVIDYSRTPREYVIGNIVVEGVTNYDDELLIGLSGLSVGQVVTLPGEEITQAIKRYWRNGLFSNVAISADSIRNDSVFLHIQLTARPRISQINYNGVKKSEKEDLAYMIKYGTVYALGAGVANGLTNMLSMVVNTMIAISIAAPLRAGSKIIISFLISTFIFKERFYKRQILGVILGAIGVILLCV